MVELRKAVYLFGSQDRADACKRADRFISAAKKLRAAMADLGDDFEARVIQELSAAGDPWLPLCAELCRVEREVSRARAALPPQRKVKSPSVLDPLTRILATAYQGVTGRDPRDSATGPFVRGVLIAHDSLPPAMQDRNKKNEDLGGKVREAVRRMQRDGSLGVHHDYQRRVGKAAEWLEARPAAEEALGRLEAAGGCGPIEPSLLQNLLKARLVEDFAGCGTGLTALAEGALAQLREKRAKGEPANT